MNEKNNLTPFKMCMLENFPFVEAYIDAADNYQFMCKVVEYLNNVIKQTNENTKAVNYIKNYFNNLDVQDEINNKLDEMATSGELTDIIAQYLKLAGVLAYNTVNEMKNATNLTNGSITKTLGNKIYNDGYGSFYKIRNITTSDSIDNIIIIK